MEVWQDSIDLVEVVYKISESFPVEERFGLTNQMRRCSVSIASNLAEGTSRITQKDKSHFSTMAFSSTMELLNQVIISKRLNFIDDEAYKKLRAHLLMISNKINALRNAQLKK
ncbi:four helix bundle protein [Aequorivita sp. F7]|uniref:four helix bundle protein n=1 Tax=Aequorivita sp. F7 TaxID=2879117 RepID=UPI0021D4253A|nr:four helix bundle protein [Aequorivita sp. F7]